MAAFMPSLDFLSPEAVIPYLRVSGKKQVLNELASHAARLTGLDERSVFEALLQLKRVIKMVLNVPLVPTSY